VTFSAHVELASRSRAYCSTLSFCAASSPHARAPAADAIGSSVSAMMAVIAAAQPEREDLQRLGVQDGAADLEAEALPPVELQQPRLEPRDVEVRLLAVLDAALIACMSSSAAPWSEWATSTSYQGGLRRLDAGSHKSSAVQQRTTT